MYQTSAIDEALSYGSNNNAVLNNGCDNLQNLTVLLEAGSDIATIDNGGWSLQLNCYVPPGHSCQTSQVNFLQFIVIVQGGVLEYYVQYWAVGASTFPSGFTPLPGTTPWLPCWAHDFGDAPTFATGLTGDTLPNGSKLQIALATDSVGNIDAATFTYTSPQGNAQSGVFVPPVAHPICAFELNFVGPPCGTATFLPTAPSVISYSVSAGQLSEQSGGPGSACGEVNATTAETSNMTYSDISGAPGATVTQLLEGPIPWVTPTSVTFPTQQIGTTSLDQQTVTVFAGSQVTVTGISFVDETPGASADFASVPGPGGGSLNVQNGQLAITVFFRPTAGGTRNAQLQIAHNAEGSPLIVELSGVGDAAPLPLLNFSPASLYFTTKKITNHTVTLSNTGTAPLIIGNIVIDGPSGFTFGSTCNVGAGGGILNPGQACAITVAYHGVVYASATLVITHNAVGSPAIVDLEADPGSGPQR